MRRSQFRYTAGATLYAVSQPIDQNTPAVVSGTESTTRPGVYQFDNGPDAPMEVFAQVGMNPDTSVDLAVGVIGEPTYTDPMSGTAKIPDSDSLLAPLIVTPPGWSPVGNVDFGTDLELYGLESYDPDDTLGRRGVDMGGGESIDLIWQWAIDSGKFPTFARFLLAPQGSTSWMFQEWDQAANTWHDRRRVYPQAEPQMVQIPFLRPVGSVAVATIRIKTDTPDDSDAGAFLIVSQAELVQGTSGGGSGSAVFPDPSDVALGVEYGPNGDDYTGTAEDLGTIPAETDVRLGIPVGGGVGNVLLPPQAEVALGYMYGANSNEFTGTLDCGTSGGSPGLPPAPLDALGNLTIVRGDTYDASTQFALWSIPAAWGDLAGAEGSIGWRGISGADEYDLTLDEDARTVSLFLTAAQTVELQSAADYRYDIQITMDSGKVRTLTMRNLTVLDTYSD